MTLDQPMESASTMFFSPHLKMKHKNGYSRPLSVNLGQLQPKSVPAIATPKTRTTQTMCLKPSKI
jgi:hypothetical protein